MNTQHFPDEDQQILDERPWLEPFIEDGDTSIDAAIERYERAMTEVRAEVRATGHAVYRRMQTADGHETTALATHPKGHT